MHKEARINGGDDQEGSKDLRNYSTVSVETPPVAMALAFDGEESGCHCPIFSFKSRLTMASL